MTRHAIEMTVRNSEIKFLAFLDHLVSIADDGKKGSTVTLVGPVQVEVKDKYKDIIGLLRNHHETGE